MISMDGVTKFYPTNTGRHYILRDASFEISEKCNIGIVGRNGAGKSTLLRLLGGIDYPNHGEIKTDGRISWPMGLHGGLQGSLTGRDNARFVCRIFGDTEDEVARKIDFILDFTELGNYFDMPVNTYSSGMRARLTFATSIAFDFDVYLLDEITAVGDQRFKEKSSAALQEKKDKAYIIKVSHNLQELINDCDVGIYLDNEDINIFGDIKDAVSAYQASQG